ncbi:pentatricopeptide repeat-containing protein 2, mitochondrial [Rhineura floridana]|uniref:pentatricopeptide repeat-containing protein 2, mitochondrial n=1 Tax=Rhineura floridana TaxID=261503 RepID=UPI002AC8486D|nr:pentatricopeptide repeat-containing protein 2, mitochondrial [Rhineura floridana]
MATGVIEGSNRILRESVKRYMRVTLSAAAPAACWNCPQGAKRYLLTEDTVQLQRFQQHKLATEYKIYGEKDTYFKIIEDKLAENKLIFKHEMKLLLHLCQTKDEFEIVKKTIYRYYAENKNVAFGTFRFGPLFMRLCYEMNFEESALELIKDQALHGFFSDSTSFNLLMDMLFIKGHYERALEVLLEMKRQGVKFNNETYLLAVAICYKLNNSESCKICTTLLENRELSGNHMSKRIYYFAVAFALKQKDVGMARSFFSQIINTDNRICINLKILLQAASGDLEDLVQTLKTASETSASYFVKKPEFCMQVLSTAREKLKDNPVLCVQFGNIFAKLQASGQIMSLTLDDLLCQPTSTKRRHLPLLKQNQVSHWTSKPLCSPLLAE